MHKFTEIIGEVVLLIPLFIISAFIDLWAELIIITVLLFLYKPLYKVGYHADKSYVCIIISYSTIAICLIISYVFKGEYFILIMLCNAIAFVNACIGKMQVTAKKYEVIKEPYAELVAFYNESIQEKQFNVDTCTKDELIARCQELHFSAENTELAVLFFIDKVKHSVIADKLCVDEKSVTTRKKRMKIKLNALK